MTLDRGFYAAQKIVSGTPLPYLYKPRVRRQLRLNLLGQLLRYDIRKVLRADRTIAIGQQLMLQH